MSVTRSVNLAFVALGLLLWFVATEFFAWVLQLFGPTVDIGLIGVGFRLSNLLGFVAGLTTVVVLWRNERVGTIAHEIANELKKVTWPTWSETRVSTLVVIVVTTIAAIILGLYDAFWSFLTNTIYHF